MARGEFKIKAIIETDDRASGAIGKVTSSFQRFGNFLRSRFVITLGDVDRAIRGTISAISSFVEAATDQEDAVNALNSALKSLGPAAEGVSAGLQAQAAALQQTTKFSDEAIVRAQALLATYAVTPDRLQKATQATLDLATAMGTDLDTAAKAIGATFSGTVRELGRIVPELKDLSAEALASGAAIDVLAEKLEGRAAAAGQTFSGQIERLRNSFGEFQERIGESITQNEGLRASFENLNTALRETPALVSLAASALGAFARGIADTLKNTNAEIQAISRWSDSLSNLAGFMLDTAKAALGLSTETDKLTQSHVEAAAAIDVRAAGEARLAGIMEAEAATFASLSAKAKELGVTLDATVNQQIERNAALLIEAENAARQGVITWNDYEKIQQAVTGSTRTLNTELERQASTMVRLGQAAAVTTRQVAALGSVQSRINRVSSPELTGRNASGMNSGFGSGPSRFIPGMTTYR